MRSRRPHISPLVSLWLAPVAERITGNRAFPHADSLPVKTLSFAVSCCNSRFTGCTAFEFKHAIGALPFARRGGTYEKARVQFVHGCLGHDRSACGQYGACPNWKRCSEGKDPV